MFFLCQYLYDKNRCLVKFWSQYSKIFKDYYNAMVLYSGCTLELLGGFFKNTVTYIHLKSIILESLEGSFYT